MRKYMKVIIWVIVISFVAFIFAAWGAKWSQGQKIKEQYIAEINGEGIDYSVYSQKLFELSEDFQATTGKTPDKEIKKNLEDQAWEKMIEDYIVSREAKKRNLTASDSEIYLFARNLMFLPAWITNSPSMHTNNQFDPQKYLRFLSTPNNREVIRLIAHYRETIPRWKLQTIIASGSRVPVEEAKEFFAKREDKVKLSYVLADIKQIVKDNELTKNYDDAKLKEYYKANQSKFQVEERRYGKYIFIKASPLKEDTLKAKSKIDSIYTMLQAGKNFADLARKYSEDPGTSKNGGDLGFIKADSEFSEKFKDESFALKKGDLSKPFLTEFGYHIIKIDDEKALEKSEPEKKKETKKEDETAIDKDREIKVRHILIRIDISEKATTSAAKKANQILEAIRTQKNFDKVVTDNNLEIHKTKEILADKTGGNYAKELNDFFLYAQKSELSDIIKGIEEDASMGYYIGQLIDIKPAGLRDFNEVKEDIAMELALNDAMDISKKQAQSALEDLKNGTAWENIEIKPKETEEFNFFEGHEVLGNESDFIQTAWTISLDKVSEIFKSKNGYFFFKVKKHDPVDIKKFNASSGLIFMGINNMKQAWIFDAWLKNMKTTLKITDYRDKFKSKGEEL
ncbi:MAG: peptidylprolyl isomerase [Candidatus Coatesbacteria bacterium]|nr:peptidylprolyl isomerase [Candidatus Coatesbacteria bacterium]